MDKIPEGGYLTDDIQKLFVPNPDQDEIILLERDKRGQITQKTDQEGCVSTYQYNGFKKSNKSR